MLITLRRPDRLFWAINCNPKPTRIFTYFLCFVVSRRHNNIMVHHHHRLHRGSMSRKQRPSISQEMFPSSEFVADTEHLPTLEWCDLRVEKRLGEGSFSMILQVSPKACPEICLALKCLKEGELDSNTRQIAMLDLHKEVQLLSTLQHPNILSAKGIASQEDPERFFFVMGMLQDTLQERLEQWRLYSKSPLRRGLSFRCSSDKSKTTDKRGMLSRSKSLRLGGSAPPCLADRLFIAFKLSKALLYLQSKGIVHCDLKPSNVGFNERGQVKLFDFGLSRNIHEDCLEGEIVGSRRYMAPGK